MRRWLAPLSRARHHVLEALLAVVPQLYSRWFDRSRSPKPATEQRAASVQGGRRAVLLVDHDFPEIDRDAGSRAILSFAKLVDEAGFELVFWAASTTPSAAGRAALHRAGIHACCRGETGSLEEWLRGPGRAWNLAGAVLSRPLIAAMYLPVIRRNLPGPCIYYGHDIHFRRLQAMRRIDAISGRGLLWQRWVMSRVERRLWQYADVVLYPSQEEADEVNAFRRARALAGNAEMFPLWTLDGGVCVGAPGGRQGLLFVGSYAHAPNVDGLDWFLREVQPKLKLHAEQRTLTIVGSGMEAYVPPPSTTQVRILGRVDDATLDACYGHARVVIAPLRFGGGVKGKVLEAIGKGVPCVMSTAGAQGLDGLEAFLPVSDDPQVIISAIQQLVEDDAAWVAAASGASAYLRQRYDAGRFRERLRQVLGA
ncbi:glycosyltransferase [Stenotrophomonas maltophilia]|uniref:glycosyltransferase n=1 Tax=Stenotrophomonas muris TaxID=2963283 RepID=UPI0018D463ED|nr:glycosyltransferase family 4 protein [Stenotrophomonas maltophilia]